MEWRYISVMVQFLPPDIGLLDSELVFVIANLQQLSRVSVANNDTLPSLAFLKCKKKNRRMVTIWLFILSVSKVIVCYPPAIAAHE